MCSQNTRKLMLAKSMGVMINYITKYDWLEAMSFCFIPSLMPSLQILAAYIIKKNTFSLQLI